MYGDYIAYDCWLGKVYDLKNQIILKLSNGARWVWLWLGPGWAGRAGGVFLVGLGCQMQSRGVTGAAGTWPLASRGLALCCSPYLRWLSSAGLRHAIIWSHSHGLLGDPRLLQQRLRGQS